MNDDNTSVPAEIVIVRRRGGDDTPTKGGAWKIAYADFVTAMMAFFLVMWLINASNEATRAQVASYFNPIKLTDNTTGKKGLKEPKDHTEQSKEEASSAGGTPPAPSDVKQQSEIMSNPDKVLEKIEAQAKAQMAVVAEVAPAPASAEAAPADPFEPPPSASAAQSSSPKKAATPEAATPAKEAPSSFSAEKLEPAPADAPPASTPPLPKLKPETAAAEQPKAHEDLQPAPAEKPAASNPTPEPVAPKIDEAKAAAEAAKAQETLEAQQIADEIAKKLGTGLDKLPESVDVKRTDNGILISLTDKENFGMFLNGSAEPVPELVALIDAIAGVLKDRNGYIVVRGHTDSKPYRIKTYDNWQLSTDRAHFAQYMLVRAGLDGSRVRRIEGVADREPRNPNDPQAPENRRIEILLGRDTKT